MAALRLRLKTGSPLAAMERPPAYATSKWCRSATDQRHQHLRRDYLPDASDGDRPDPLIGQLQLQPIARVAKIRAGLVRTERTAPAVEASALVGTERSHAGYACAVDEDQPCRTGVGGHSDQL